MDFHQWYYRQYGERWEHLKTALLQPVVHTEYSQGLVHPYLLEESSLHAALALDVQPGEQVLDACAAPGGKTLILAVSLQGKGLLIANDRSSARRARLHRVIQEYLPDSLKQVISVTSHDASRWGLYEQNAYDRILLDVPCSSERHLLNTPKELSRWSPNRSKRLSIQQFAIAAAALDAVKPGGRILYSTCSISNLENDDVIEKLLHRRHSLCRIEPPPAIAYGEKTRYGWIILPDQAAGHGPMFIARIKKTGDRREHHD